VTEINKNVLIYFGLKLTSVVFFFKRNVGNIHINVRMKSEGDNQTNIEQTTVLRQRRYLQGTN